MLVSRPSGAKPGFSRTTEIRFGSGLRNTISSEYRKSAPVFSMALRISYSALGVSRSSWSSSARYSPSAISSAALLFSEMPPFFSSFRYRIRGSADARLRQYSPTSPWASSLPSARHSSQSP